MTSIPAAIAEFNNSKKRRLILAFLIEILKCAWNLEDLEKKDECHSLIISEIIVSERGYYWNV